MSYQTTVNKNQILHFQISSVKVANPLGEELTKGNTKISITLPPKDDQEKYDRADGDRYESGDSETKRRLDKVIEMRETGEKDTLT